MEESKRDAKNTVFIDLFHIPQYMYLLFKTLHPEMTDVTIDDIKTITLKPIIIKHPYNDLAFLVKGRLIIFVEAQSTWSINILIRALLYLAITYQDYIVDHKLFVYGTKKISVPEPEFYVIYTGDNKNKKDTISLRTDFLNNPEAPIDLVAKVIHAENKQDILGQYIIFCHVLDKQIAEYGRTIKAVEETIRICKSEDVLKEYLASREKEVLNIMITLFSQENAIEAFGAEQQAEGKKINKVEQIRGWFNEKSTLPMADAARFAKVTIPQFESVVSILQSNPELTDEDIAGRINWQMY